MRRILVFGNSGSGKSTLAKQLCDSHALSHLDLDTLAWEPTTPPERKPLAASAKAISRLIESSESWVIEGCYSDLLELAVPFATQMIYLDLPVEACIANARARPWEPHKYPSKAAQDANLEMLLEWISRYADRDDTFSRRAHLALYESFPGEKTVLTKNGDLGINI